MMNALYALNLYKTFKNRKVVNNVSLNVLKGEIVGLLGPVNAGITTTLEILAGIISPDTGKICFDNKEITNFSIFQRANLGIAYLGNKPSIFREFSVEKNILAVLEQKYIRKADQKLKMEMLIEEFELTKKRKKAGKLLSEGERRRTEIARALAINPGFVLLDEPFTGLDNQSKEIIKTSIRKMKDENLGILISDRSANETFSVVDRAYLMFEGKLLKSGTVDELRN